MYCNSFFSLCWIFGKSVLLKHKPTYCRICDRYYKLVYAVENVNLCFECSVENC